MAASDRSDGTPIWQNNPLGDDKVTKQPTPEDLEKARKLGVDGNWVSDYYESGVRFGGGLVKGGEKLIVGLAMAIDAIAEDPWHAPGKMILAPFEAPMRGAAMLWNAWDQTWSNVGENISQIGQHIAENPAEAAGEIAFDVALMYVTGKPVNWAYGKVLPRGLHLWQMFFSRSR